MSNSVEQIAKDFNLPLDVVGIQYTKILLHLGKQYKDKGYDFYRIQSDIQARTYFKAYKVID